MKFFYYEFTVDEDAIDVNRHANNARYVIWMQEAATRTLAQQAILSKQISRKTARGWCADTR